jgi:hypothetical protein
MANFAVFVIGAESAESFKFHGDASYQLLDSGAVQVIDPENERQIHFGPAAWSRIEETGGDYRINDSAW